MTSDAPNVDLDDSLVRNDTPIQSDSTTASPEVRATGRIGDLRIGELRTPFIVQVVEMLENGIEMRIATHGLISNQVADAKLELAMSLRRFKFWGESIPRLMEVIALSQRVDLVDGHSNHASSRTVQSRAALRDSFAQLPGAFEETARRATMNRVALRGPGTEHLRSLSESLADLYAFTGNFDEAIANAQEVFDDAWWNFGTESFDTLAAAARVALSFGEAEQFDSARQYVSLLQESTNGALAVHGRLGAWERDRLVALEDRLDATPVAPKRPSRVA